MGNESEARAAYVRRMAEDARHFSEELLQQNRHLRTWGAGLEVERDEARAAARVAREEAARAQAEHAALRRRLDDLMGESARQARECAEVQRNTANLANLYVASYRLHCTLDREEVLGVIREVLANLVGSEEIALFERRPGEHVLHLSSASGVDLAGWPPVRVGEGIVGGSAATGRIWVAGKQPSAGLPHEKDVTACVPLKLEEEVTGVLAVFRLLPQKAGFEEVDHEMFELLATHAATALYLVRLHAESRPGRA